MSHSTRLPALLTTRLPAQLTAILLTGILLTGAAPCTHRDTLTVSGKVIDPFSRQGIPGIFVAFQGEHATGIMGGTEYRDDLALVRTDPQGAFRLQIPNAQIDSFIQKYPTFLNVYRFGLEVRCDSNSKLVRSDIVMLHRFLYVDTGFNFYDRNTLNQRTLVFTDKNKRLDSDSTGMTIPLYRAGYLHFNVTGDFTDWSRNLIYIHVQESGGKHPRQDYAYIGKEELPNKIMVSPATPLDIIIARWHRDTGRLDTLSTLHHLVTQPAAVTEIPLHLPG